MLKSPAGTSTISPGVAVLAQSKEPALPPLAGPAPDEPPLDDPAAESAPEPALELQPASTSAASSKPRAEVVTPIRVARSTLKLVIWDRRHAIGVPDERAELNEADAWESARTATLTFRVQADQRGEKAACGSLPHL